MFNTSTFTSGNNFPEPSFSIGGGRPVWFEIGKELPGGFSPDLTKFPKGSVVQEGTPIKVNETTRTAEVHLASALYEATGSDLTKLKLAKVLGNSTFSVGQFLILAPSTITGTATASKITAIDSSNKEYDAVTLSVALATAAPAGSVFVEADKDGAGAKIKVIPNALTRHDIYVDPNSTQFTCGAVVEGTIYERRISPVIDPIKELFNGEITFSKSK